MQNASTNKCKKALDVCSIEKPITAATLKIGRIRWRRKEKSTISFIFIIFKTNENPQSGFNQAAY